MTVAVLAGTTSAGWPEAAMAIAGLAFLALVLWLVTR